MSSFDPSSHQQFYEYYANASQTEETRQRFASVRECILRVLKQKGTKAERLKIADVGCGAGTQCLMWAEIGCEVHGVDVNEPLLDLARKRAGEAGHSIDYRLGSAGNLPWPNESMDVCLVLELLEHVAEWKVCLDEFSRILRPGGILFLTTTNKLCPIQQEFILPLYSWYPAPVKRFCERLAVTSRPSIAHFAKYPAVNWFSFYSLREALSALGFKCLDRFDVIKSDSKGKLAGSLVELIRRNYLLRWLAHVGTPGTIVVAVKTESVSL